ncbi:hypothetical protein ACHAWT_009608 [Skeletonema menzelii]
MSEPVAFPRGKRKSTTSTKDDTSHPSKKHAPSASSTSAAETIEKDFLFGSSATSSDLVDASGRSKRGGSSSSSSKQQQYYDMSPSVVSQLPLGGGAVLPAMVTSSGKRIPPKIELLSFSKLAKGTKVLGVIREVTPDYAVVSLPTMLTGFVRRADENDAPLTRILPSVNTVMAFSIVSTTTQEVSKKDKTNNPNAPVKKRRIELSPWPIHVNAGVNIEEFLKDTANNDDSMMAVRGRIVSVEDHGCIVDLGGIASGRQAFLKFENVDGEYDVDDEDSDDEDNDAMDTDGAATKRILHPGRIYDFCILPSSASQSILQVSLPTIETLTKLRASPSMAPTISSLQPGMLAEVQVEAHAKNGMCVSFMKGVYRGALDEDHLGGHRGVDEGKKKHLDKESGDPTMWWKNVFKGKLAKFTARIIAVDTSTKIVRFSINHHILALNGEYAAFPHSVGTIIKNAQVIRVDAGIGALLALPGSEDAEEQHSEELRKLDKELSNNLFSNSDYRAATKVSTAYVHISKSMDNPDADSKKGKQTKNNNNRTPDALFARHFSINTRVKALRILATSNLIDGIASCATAKSIVDAHVLTHADIVPGKIYKDVPVVQLLDSGGVLVDLGIGTKGIIPATHLFDKASHGSLDAGGDLTISGYRQKIRQQKYKVGNKITVRCLTVDPAARQCVLTAKKTLLTNDIDDPIVEYPVAQDRVAAGFLSKVDDTGLTVTFYNNVHGRVTSRSLAAELGVEDPRQNYNVGDAIVARVLSCERRRNRTVYDGDDLYYYQLKLSLKTVVDKVDTSTSLTQVSDGSAVPFAAGSIVMQKRMKVLQIVNCLSRDDGAFFSGYAILSIKSKFFTGLPVNAGDSVEFKLPFDQLSDSYEGELSNPPIELDKFGHKMLTVGKRIEAEVVILTIPNGAGSLPVVSLRPTLINSIKMASSDDSPVICPSLKSNLFIGKYVCGYITRIDERFGAFVRFLDGLTGLIPKLKKGLNENLFDTIFCKVTALDITSSPPKILLKKVTESEAYKSKKRTSSKNNSVDEIQVGDVVGDVKVVDINFARAKVYIVGNDSSKLRARIHVTMANSLETTMKLSKKEKQFKEEHKIGKSHPFYNWKVGDIIPGVRCVSTDTRDGIAYVELANRVESGLPAVVTEPSHLPPGSILSAIVTSASKSSTNHGLWVQVCPGVSGFIPALEVSEDPDVLNDLAIKFKVGSRITCCVMEQTGHNKLPVSHNLQKDDHDSSKDEHKALFLSVLLVPGEESDKKDSGFKPTKPQRSDIVIGRVNKKSIMQGPPSLMLSLRGGFIGRCCITELTDENEWTNMPFGRVHDEKSKTQERNTQQQVVSDSDADHENDDDKSLNSDDENDSDEVQSDFPDGKYFRCRVLGNAKSKGIVELSLRESRLKGVMDNDAVPKVNDIAHAYVVSTTKKGCFVRLSRSVEGRVILKELSDDFVPNPSAMFPPGRLVVGKIKGVKDAPATKKGAASFVDFDMRESVLLATGDRVTVDDIKEFSKYTGVITRVESYGCFCRIDNSDISGLAHVSECSDSFVKNIHDLYNPGDLVKLVVIKIDKEQGRLGFSLKASNFVDDDDSSSDSNDGSSAIDAMEEDSDDDASSDDENFVTKMAAKMHAGEDEEDSETESESEDDGESSDSESDDSDEEMEDNDAKAPHAMDTNVGFDWDGIQPKTSNQKGDESSSDDDSSDSSDDGSDDEDTGFKSSHKARKKTAAKKREEEEISRREAALADGTADQNPETAADFERLVAGNPNSSELWIKYMAFHLSLADIDSARNVANRSFDRIEFRQEGEKLNVWTALLTLELKYGNEKSLQQTIDRACQHNNPKQVYMRVCELLDKEVDAAASSIGSSDLDSATSRADAMFTKMCKKFKSKKSVWIAHFKYLFKGSRHDEAHKLLKRSLQSLPSYKHVETMSKFAQLEFELGSPERGRTIYNGLLEKHPKRMDLLFVNIDKEVKSGDISKARALFESVVNPVASGKKFNFGDKQMKSLFKKWYRVEEEHGDSNSQERVKEEARKFVANSTARKTS